MFDENVSIKTILSFRPMATVVKSKRKRKRGYDSGDEMNAMDTIITTPPDSPEDSLIEVINYQSAFLCT